MQGVHRRAEKHDVEPRSRPVVADVNGVTLHYDSQGTNNLKTKKLKAELTQNATWRARAAHAPQKQSAELQTQSRQP